MPPWGRWGGSTVADIIVTWPKTRALDSYLKEVRKAWHGKRMLCFRVSSRPDCDAGDRCYQVHGGFVRGWLPIQGVIHTDDAPDDFEITDPLTGEQWPRGLYVVRHPVWNDLSGKEVPMVGFQGFRYVGATSPLKRR